MAMKLPMILLSAVLFLASCANTKSFPVSDLAPAAEITVKEKTRKNENNIIIVKAKYLASPERVSRNAEAYVVWLVSEKNGVKNIGALYNKNGRDSELETPTPFKGSEIFITAEKKAGVSRPEGPEITRVKL